jgi:DGQHR domain-containing protein
MVDNTIEIPVVKLIQQGKTIYVGKMKAGDLLSHGIPTEWDPGIGWDLQQQGYQRSPDKKHYTRIGNFLKNEGDPLLPTAALLAAREHAYGLLNFTSIPNHPDLGIIKLQEARNLFIVDYQHRWRGLDYAINNLGCSKLSNFQIPVIIMADVSNYEEIRQFYLINNKQKKINTDLALALLQTMSTAATDKELENFVGPSFRYRIRATRLAFKIAEKPQGQWVGKIIEPNIPANGNQVISIKSFVDSLKPILVKTSPVKNKTDDELIPMIQNYWDSIQTILPNAINNPLNHSIQQAIGVFVMHRLAGKKIFAICKTKNDFSSSHISSLLLDAKNKLQALPPEHHYLDEQFWVTGGLAKTYSSSSGQNDLADKIIPYI